MANKQSSDFFYIFLFIICLLIYVVYDQHTENERLFNVCKNQDLAIQDLCEAIRVQKIYINELEYYYQSFYNQNNPKNKNDSPIHH